MAFKWGVYGVESEEEAMRLATSTEEDSSATWQKYLITGPSIFMAISLCIRLMLFCVTLSQKAGERFGENSLTLFFPMMCYAAIPIFLSAAYRSLATLLNDFEGHKSQQKYANALTLKLFAFQFVNFFSALFYIGFYLMDIKRLSGMLFSLSFARQITGNSMEEGWPLIKDWLKKHLKSKPGIAKALDAPKKPPLLKTVSEFSQWALKSAPKKRQKYHTLLQDEEAYSMESFLSQIDSPVFNPHEEFLEMIIQFGFSTLFAVAFPLAPLFAYLNNLAEYKIDLRNLLKARRPRPVASSSIGSWMTCLEAVGYLATLTNCCLLVYLGNSLGNFLPDEAQNFINRIEGKVLLALGLEHILLAIKFIMAGALLEEPYWVTEAVAKNKLRLREAARKMRLAVHGLKQSNFESKDDIIQKQKDKAISMLKLIYKECGAWSFDPILYAALVALPYLIGYYNLSYYSIFPFAMMIIGFMHHKRDSIDDGILEGLIVDRNIRKKIDKEIPAWYRDSESERVEWLNRAMQHIWPNICITAEEMTIEIVQPMLELYKPPGIDVLQLTKVSLGDLAPSVVGIKMLDANESVAVLDLEAKWAGNPEIVVEVGRKGMLTTNLTLSEIRFSGKIRAEMAPLVPLVPCFGSLSISLMNMPTLDYSFKVGCVDVLSIGPGNLSIKKIVSNVVQQVMKDMLLYPTKFTVPIMYDEDVAKFTTPAPKGILQIEMVGADKLRKADVIGKSDPYVVISLGASVEKTKVIDSTLDPRWDEKFDMLVYDKAEECIKFKVFDKDIDSDDFLGKAEVQLSDLNEHEIIALNLPLRDTSTGNLMVRLCYVPLKKKSTENEEVDPDVIFDFPENELTDEMVGSVGQEQGRPSVFVSSTENTDETDNKRHRKIGTVFNAVRSTFRISHATENIPTEPMTLIDPSDQSFGILRISNLHVQGVKPTQMYCVIKQGHNHRETMVSGKLPEASWMTAMHMLVHGAKTAQVEVSVMEKQSIGSNKKIGSCTFKVIQLSYNDNEMEIFQSLEGENAKGTIRFLANWIPAEEKE